MATITEDYVSFETAKLLKEKGFDGECLYVWIDSVIDGVSKELISNCVEDIIVADRNIADNKLTNHYLNIFGEDMGYDAYLCPALSMTMKWLREVHYIHIEICLYKTSENNVESKKSKKAPYYTFGVWNSVTGDNIDKRLTNDFIGDTYEQACEAGIKYCLEHLIE